MSRDEEARQMAKDAMRQVIYTTADLNSRGLAASCQSVEGAGQQIVEGAVEGLVAWLVEACPEGMEPSAFVELALDAVRQTLSTHQMLAAPAAGSA